METTTVADQHRAEDRGPIVDRRAQHRTGLLPWQARRVLEYIEQNMGKPISVPDLSALVNRDKSHFSRTFKQSFGAPPHNYVLRRRIQLASRLMIESVRPLSQIALICGFSDQAHFSRRFKKETGTTPRAWRRARIVIPYAASASSASDSSPRSLPLRRLEVSLTSTR